MKTFTFTSYGNREMTLEQACANAGEFMRDAHDLCCWPIQAAPLRRQAEAIYAEVAAFRKAEELA